MLSNAWTLFTPQYTTYLVSSQIKNPPPHISAGRGRMLSRLRCAALRIESLRAANHISSWIKNARIPISEYAGAYKSYAQLLLHSTGLDTAPLASAALCLPTLESKIPWHTFPHDKSGGKAIWDA